MTQVKKDSESIDFPVGLHALFEAGVPYTSQWCGTGPTQKPDGEGEKAQGHQAQHCHSSNKSTCHCIQWWGGVTRWSWMKQGQKNRLSKRNFSPIFFCIKWRFKQISTLLPGTSILQSASNYNSQNIVWTTNMATALYNTTISLTNSVQAYCHSDHPHLNPIKHNHIYSIYGLLVYTFTAKYTLWVLPVLKVIIQALYCVILTLWILCCFWFFWFWFPISSSMLFANRLTIACFWYGVCLWTYLPAFLTPVKNLRIFASTECQ